MLIVLSSSDAVTLTGSSEYAVPGTEFTLTCDVPEEANLVQFYRRPDVTATVGDVQVAGDQCYNTKVNQPVPCTPDVCSCVASGGLGTVFRWIIQPQTGDHGSVWYCRLINFNLPDPTLDSADYTLIVADGPGTSIALSPPDTTYTRTEGDTLPDITCTADCRPGCIFVWTRPDNTNFTVSPVLSLGQLDRSEHGTYRCTASNVVGESTIMTSVTVQYGPGTTISLSPPDTTYTRTEGDTLPDITCTADCRPGCTFVWTRPENTNFTVSPVLSLGQLDRSEHGTYLCTARNIVGETIITISVTVLYGPSTVSLTPPTVTYTPTEGHTIPTIACSSDCNPVCTYSWTNDGQSYTTGSGLQITNIQRDQGGVYRCTASNVYGSARGDDVSITIYYGPETSIALSPPDSIYTRTEGDTLPDITCTADCRPGCTFVWTRPDNTNFTVSPVLSLGQLDRSEHGTYRCTARNVVGESAITISVSVQYGPGSSLILSPRETRYTGTEGDMLPDITCTADCRPDCTFVWTRPDNTNFTVSPVLSLGQLDSSEHGTYRCTARNAAGESTKVISVTTLYEPRPYQMLDQNQTLNIAQLETIILSSTFISNPAPTFTWSFQPYKSTTATDLVNGTDGVLIQNTFEASNLTAFSVLIRTNVQESWFGIYNVTAANNQGSAMISFTVREKLKPGIPRNLSIGCTKPSSAKVSWSDGGNSQYYHVIYTTDRFPNSQEVYPVAITKSTDRRDVYSLNIDNLDGGRVYFFKVVAYNTYGNATSADAVGCTVQEPFSCGTDSMYVPGVVLTVTGILTLLLTVGIEIYFRRNRKLCHRRQLPKQKESRELSDRGGRPESENERSPYQQLDPNDVAKASVYSEIGGHHHVHQIDPDNEGDGGKYESLEGRSNPNVYEELHSTTFDNRGTYINTTTTCKD